MQLNADFPLKYAQTPYLRMKFSLTVSFLAFLPLIFALILIVSRETAPKYE